MGRYILSVFLLLQAVIHLVIFTKGFDNLNSLQKAIFHSPGIVWLIAGIVLLGAAISYFTKKEYWWVLAFAGAALSQWLIIIFWSDSKFGTTVNVIILLTALAAFGKWFMKRSFKADVKNCMKQCSPATNLSETDIAHLPEPVLKYIRYCGAINKPVTKNFRLTFEGELRSRKKEWMPFVSEQYNFFENPARLFFLEAKMMHLPVTGYHCYKNAVASMKIKLAGIIPVVNAKGTELNIAETVTLFNDLCIYAPSMLADKRIKWETIDGLTAKAFFNNGSIHIAATLVFNEKGQLVNFISDDRLDINEKKRVRFSTPIRDYKMINGVNVAAYGETIWHYPEGEFIYGKFRLKQIEYNLP